MTTVSPAGPGKIDSLQQFSEPGVRSQGRKEWVHIDKDKPADVVLDSFLKECERTIPIPEADMNDGHIVGRNVLAPRHVLQLIEQSFRLRSVS